MTTGTIFSLVPHSHKLSVVSLLPYQHCATLLPVTIVPHCNRDNDTFLTHLLWCYIAAPDNSLWFYADDEMSRMTMNTLTPYVLIAQP